MEGIVFVGIQGSGKSTFFKERFFLTHVHISLDLLKTRHREQRILADGRFVIEEWPSAGVFGSETIPVTETNGE